MSLSVQEVKQVKVSGSESGPKKDISKPAAAVDINVHISKDESGDLNAKLLDPNAKYGVADEEMMHSSAPKSFKNCCRICRCNCRDCLCFVLGVVIALVLGVVGFTAFILLTNNNVHTHPALIPSTADITNYTSQSDAIALRWTSADENGAVIQYYRLQYQLTTNAVGDSDSDDDWIEYQLSDHGLYGHATITALRGSSHYNVRLCAHNSIGDGNWTTAAAIATKSPIVPTAPNPPFGVAIGSSDDDIVDSDSDSLFTMGFTIGSDGGALIDQFQIYFGDVSMHDVVDYLFCNATAPSYDRLDSTHVYNCSSDGGGSSSALSSLQSNVVYNFKVRARNVVGWSSFSTDTPCVVYGVPTTIDDDLFGALYVGNGSTPVSYLFMCSVSEPPSEISDLNWEISPYEIDLSWEPPSGMDSGSAAQILYYQLQRDDWWNNTGLTNVSLTNGGLQLYASMDGLLPGITYHIRLRAFNQYGGGQWTDLKSMTTNETGACGNLYDTQILKENCETMDAGMIEIYLQCTTASDKDSCQQKKIEDEYMFSTPCSKCWVEFNDCVMGNCFSQCMSGNVQKCETCFETLCSPIAVSCTGYPAWPLWCPS